MEPVSDYSAIAATGARPGDRPRGSDICIEECRISLRHAIVMTELAYDPTLHAIVRGALTSAMVSSKVTAKGLNLLITMNKYGCVV